ncbi:MAG: hypothetical protein K6G38_06035, partial [Gammaproteobacteria bacterium]|nr:hypothetical protein [Gammaproteobacteria bacterium]
VQVTIAKANPQISNLVANQNLVYTGSAQALVTTGSTTGGELQYSLDNETFATSIPEGTNAQTYIVYYKVVGNDNYNDVAVSNISSTIAKADSTLTAPTANELTYTGLAQALVNAGTPVGGTIQYKLNDGEYSTSIPEGTNAGAYIIYYKVVGDANHNDIAENSVQVTISKAQLTVTANNLSISYNDAIPTYSVEYLGFVNNEDNAVLGGTLALACEYEVESNAGSYTITPSGYTSDNYEISHIAGTLTVNKINATLTDPTANELTYTGSAQELVNAGVPVGGTIQYKLENGEYGADIPTAINAGNYTVYYKVVGDANHNDIAEASLVVSIAKATPVVTAPIALTNLVYTGEAQALISAGSTTGGEIQYKLGTGEYGTNIPSAIIVGSYNIYYKVVGNSNYNDVAEASLSSAISKAALTVTANNLSISYNDAVPTYSVEYLGFVNNENNAVLGGTLALACEYEVGSNVGSYTITPSGYTSDNYEISHVAGTLTVNKINPEVTAPTAKSGLVYTGSEQALINAGTTSGGTIQYKLGDEEYSNDIPTGTNASTYTIYYKVVGNDNYNGVDEASLEVVISKATPVLTAPIIKEDLVYNSEAQALIDAGSANAGTLQYKLGTGEYGTDIPTATNASTYTIYYKVVGDSNYCDIAESSLEIAIAKADPTITLPTIKEGLVYSGANQELINAGNVNAGTIQYKLDDGEYGTDIPTGTNAQTYTIYYKVVGNDNYNDISESSIINTIDKKEIEIIWTNTNYTYNGSVQEITATYKDVSNESISLSITIDNEFKNAGNYTATVSFANNEKNYKLPSVATKSYEIAKATPEYTIPEGIIVIADNKLSVLTLPEGFSWANPDQSVGSVEGSKAFNALFTPVDTTNYLAVEDIDIIITIIAQWNVEDSTIEDVKAEIKGAEEVSNDIQLIVEVKVETSESKNVTIVEKPEVLEGKIENDEKIAVVFDVKLIRKVVVNGVENTTEIQPSDIKEGATIEILMAIPENLLNESFRVLHIHNDGTTQEMEYTRSADQKSVIVTTDKLSEFAFVIKRKAPSALVWTLIVLDYIVIAIATTYLLLIFVFNKWIVVDGEKTRVFIIKKNDKEVKLITRYLKIETRLLSEIYDSEEAK